MQIEDLTSPLNQKRRRKKKKLKQSPRKMLHPLLLAGDC
jgi:hypothetical protein